MKALVRAVCADCGEQIYQHADAPWIHTDTGLRWCYRDQQHTDVARPLTECGAATCGCHDDDRYTRQATAEVLGFISPCDVCGRKALTTQPLDNYVCPSCAELSGFGDVDVAQAEPTVTRADLLLEFSRITYGTDDDYPIGKVQG